MGGLAGMGDLVLTCTGDLSRNRTVGLRIGRGESLQDITASMKGAVAEGVLTSRSAYNLATKLGVDCPIIEGIYRVIHGESHSLCSIGVPCMTTCCNSAQEAFGAVMHVRPAYG